MNNLRRMVGHCLYDRGQGERSHNRHPKKQEDRKSKEHNDQCMRRPVTTIPRWLGKIDRNTRQEYYDNVRIEWVDSATKRKA